MMDEILLIGGGGHCRSVIDVIEQEKRFKIAGIIDKPELLGTSILGYEVIGCDEDLQQMAGKYTFAIVTVGQIKSASIRIKLFELAKSLGFTLPTIVSPRAYVFRHAKVGEGTIIMHDVLVNVNVHVGTNCIINTKALIEHDSVIGNNCHVSTGAIINGSVRIKDNSFIGSNAVTRESIVIEEGSFVKAGSVVK